MRIRIIKAKLFLSTLLLKVFLKFYKSDKEKDI